MKHLIQTWLRRPACAAIGAVLMVCGANAAFARADGHFAPAAPSAPASADESLARLARYRAALAQMQSLLPRETHVTEIDGCTIRATIFPEDERFATRNLGSPMRPPTRYHAEYAYEPVITKEPLPAEPAAPSTPALQPVPDLDELLGLKPAGSSTTPSGPSAAQQDLEQRLKEGNIDDTFKQALALMDQARTRLSDQRDAGLDTQRVQEDILRKLDQVISQAKKQQQQSSSSSSSSSSKPDPQSGQQPNQPQPQDAQSAAERAAQEQRAKDANANAMLPARQSGDLRPGLDSARAAWGNLPERLRQSLLQGSGEKFSSTYERMTEEYYRRLAEKREP